MKKTEKGKVMKSPKCTVHVSRKYQKPKSVLYKNEKAIGKGKGDDPSHKIDPAPHLGESE